MKKTLSLILSIVMLLSIVSAVNFTSFATEETETLINTVDVTIDFKSVTFEETLNNSYVFTPSKTDYYCFTVDNENISYTITDSNESKVNQYGKYFYLKADEEYTFTFTSANFDEFYSNLWLDDDYSVEGNAEYSETAVLSIYMAVNSMVDTYNYTITDNGITINAYLNPNLETNNDVVIPDTILGYPVTTLGMDSFTAALLAKTITVPNSVTKIDFGAFYACKDTTIVIENPNCEIVETYELPYVGLTLNNGEASPMTFDDVIATLESTLDITIDEETKELYTSIYDVNEDGYIKLWTIRPTATLKAAHKSTAKSYSKEWGCRFIGTDEHNFELTETEAATCTKEGYNEYECTLCDETKTEPIPMLAHTPVTDAAVAPTCTNDGKTEGSHCSVCGEILVAQKAVKAKGHKSDKGTVTKKPTYTETGIKTYKCTVCGAVVKTETIAKLPKKANTLVAKGKTATVKFRKLKKKNQTVLQKNAFAISKAQGKVTYKKTSGNKKITVAKNGKITVKKGLKKGTYKVKVKVTAAGNTQFNAVTKTVTVTIKVK